jgi:PIN domain nuclease of toxin-antitoxin system
MADRANSVFVSAASAWELATKVRLGKLPSMGRRIAEFDTSVREDGFHHLAVQHQHGVMGGSLDSDHRDPFDRLLAAQAQSENLVILTRDRAFVAMGCKVLW